MASVFWVINIDLPLLTISFSNFPELAYAADSKDSPPKTDSRKTNNGNSITGIVFPILAPQYSSGFGMRNHPILKQSSHHNGLDIAAPEYSHVRAIYEGTVVFADTYANYGKLVTIRHKGNTASMYGHLSEIRVNVGQRVKTGEIIGRVGSTGRSTGAHLHFEFKKNGVSVNPLIEFPYLFKEPEG